MENPDRHEEYFWERYQILVRTETDSQLYNILSGVGPIKTFSDVRTVLQMYDAAAEKIKPNYWENRASDLMKYRREQLDLIGSPIRLPNTENYCHDFVITDESFLAGEFEDVTNKPL